MGEKGCDWVLRGLEGGRVGGEVDFEEWRLQSSMREE